MFRNWILNNFPFLEDDFDALTDYELFCKFMGYVKQLAADNEDFRKELDDLENKINNLDLQTEVDAKLDEMASDGTLAEIINQEIFGELNEAIAQNTEDIGSINTAITNLPDDEADIAALKKFNQYTNQPLKYSKLDLSTYLPTLDFNVYRNLDGTIKTDFNFVAYDSSNKIYVNRDTGNDTSGAGTHENPFKTIKKALDYIETQAGTNYKVVVETYRFFRSEFYNSDPTNYYTPTKNVVIEPDDLTKQIVCAPDDETLSWTQDTGNTYKATRSNVSYVLKEGTGESGYGCLNKLTKATSQTECRNTQDSWYQSGNTVYLHTDGGAPTSAKYIIVLNVPVFCLDLRNNTWLRIRNCKFYSSSVMKLYNNSTTNYENRLIMENCDIYYNSQQATGNGFNCDNIKFIYFKNCRTAYNMRDGFNYHYTTMPNATVRLGYVCEEGCQSYENGFEDTENQINNASTIHEQGNILRVNGIYQNSKGPLIADIGAPHVVMLHCKTYQSANYYPFDFRNDDNTGGVAVLCDIECIGVKNYDIHSTDPLFDVKLKNYKGIYESPDVTITLYQE